MATATLTSKGQTTIPREIRKHLGLQPGDRMEFVIGEDGRVVVVPVSLNVGDLAGILPKPDRPVSLEDMQAAIRKRGSNR